MLKHPHMLEFSCEDCQAWIYDIDTGKRIERAGQPQRRQPNQPPPCQSCPRESPAKAKDKMLNRRNSHTFVLYLRNRAMFGRALNDAESGDAILQKNFGLIDMLWRRWEQTTAAESLSRAVMARVGIHG